MPDSTSLPPLIAQALRRLDSAVRQATERSVESLALAAASAANAMQRDLLLTAEGDLRRQLTRFLEVARSAAQQQASKSLPQNNANDGGTGWDDLTLVDDHELDLKVHAERMALQVTHACEWELRELEGYVAAVMESPGGDREPSPLRPEVICHGVMRAIDAVADRPEHLRAISGEMARSLASVLRPTYADIMADLRRAGVTPVSLAMRVAESRGGPHSRSGPLEGPARDPMGGRAAASPATSGAAAGAGSTTAGSTGFSGRGGGVSVSGVPGSVDPQRRGGPAPIGGMGGMGGGGGGTPIGNVDPGLMELLRRLAHVDAQPSGSFTAGADVETDVMPMPANVIRAHRDELRRASTGSLDHMVIDVIGSLFDQILADPKVPPQLARQIARLQLPVLRAALGDSTFFSNRRHPVRQFINRIASLGNGFDDFSDEQAQSFLSKVRALVQEIVTGDFDRIETYEQRLTALERYVAELARQSIDQRHGGATQLLQQREDQLRVAQHYERRLQDDLQALAAPAFVRDFVVRVWSRVILQAAQTDGVTSDRVRELRKAGRDLFMSVQPKASAAQRKAFLAELPKLMQAVNQGLNAIGWPTERRREFFGRLMPAHADALKSMGTQLDFNMLDRQVEQALDRELPHRDELPVSAVASPVLDEGEAVTFSAEEATRIGLLDESSVNWDGQVDILVGDEPELKAVDLELPGLPQLSEPADPPAGRALADRVQIGTSYQMHVDGGWQRVRLAHASSGRTFFVFTLGQRHQRTISLTYRMLTRLCETGRMRAYESAQLLERATARTRRQLAALVPAGAR